MILGASLSRSAKVSHRLPDSNTLDNMYRAGKSPQEVVEIARQRVEAEKQKGA